MTNEELKVNVRLLVESNKQHEQRIDDLEKLVLKHRMIVVAVGVVATIVAGLLTIGLQAIQLLRENAP